MAKRDNEKVSPLDGAVVGTDIGAKLGRLIISPTPSEISGAIIGGAIGGMIGKVVATNPDRKDKEDEKKD